VSKVTQLKRGKSAPELDTPTDLDDKAVVEIPSPSSGRIAYVFGAKGDIVKVGMPLVEFAEGAEQDSGTIVGELGSGEYGMTDGGACQDRTGSDKANGIAF
jgi:pyruvate/2-oxoglutarate dehydrogenase complex dihydrolipoamide acyltransferase (E2) component